MINETRLFKLLPCFFESPTAVLVEIAQNACRSGASTLAITMEADLLKVDDDGKGTDNIEAIFTLGESDWTEEVMENQMPAGWGLFFLIAISDRITYRSLFCEVSVDCEQFLNNSQYRKNLLAQVDTSAKTRRGFHITASLKEGIADKINPKYSFVTAGLSYFALDISINGNKIDRNNIAEMYKDYPIKTSYLGNDVYINPSQYMFSHLFADRTSLRDLSVIWHGIPIYHPSHYASVVIDIEKNNPLTPVLPYRKAVKDDDKLKAFIDFVRSEVRTWCLKELERYRRDSKIINEATMIRRLKLAAQVCTQADLDGLGYYYVSMVDPYYSEEVDEGETIEERIVKRQDSPIISEKLIMRIDGELVLDNEEEVTSTTKPSLPKWTVTRIDLPKNRPAWLRTEEKTVLVDVIVCDSYRKNYLWHHCSIVSEKNIKSLCTHDYYRSLDGIYFTETPEDFWEIETSVFNGRIYETGDHDVADTYDTQQVKFEKSISEDIANITGKYRLDDMLKGIKIANIYPEEIKSITINKSDLKMQVIKYDGEIVDLKLAA